METLSGLASTLVNILNSNIAVITIILGLLSIPQINKNIEKSKLNYLKISGYRTTLLKNSAILTFVSPIAIMILQKVFLEIFEKSDKGIQGNIGIIMINIYIIFMSVIIHNGYMTKSVFKRVKKRYRIVEVIIIIESVISAIAINYKNEILLSVWILILIVVWLIYFFIYLVIGVANGDNRKNYLSNIKILLEHNEIYNCYVRIICNNKNLKSFHMEENYIILESEQENSVKIIPMNKIKEIIFDYNDKI